MKQMKSKKERGITLIALVVTIIVLIILAGISINLMFGANGLIQKAKQAKIEYEESNIREKVEMLLSEYSMKEKYDNIALLGFLQQKKMEQKIDKVIDKENGTIEIELDGYIVVVQEKNLTIIEISKAGPRPTVNNIKITLEDRKTQPDNYSVEFGTKLIIDFQTNIIGGKILSVEPQIPYTTTGEETEKDFLITGDIDGKQYTKTIKVLLKDKYKLKIPEIKIDNYDWTNKSVTATVNWFYNDEAMIKEISIDSGKTYSKYTGPVKIDRNTLIKAKIKYNDVEEIGELDVTNIDKLEPKDITTTIVDENSTTQITINANTTDKDKTQEYGKSGIKGYIYYVYNGENLITKSELISDTTWNVIGLLGGENYNIYVEAYDNAGNCTKSQPINHIKKYIWNKYSANNGINYSIKTIEYDKDEDYMNGGTPTDIVYYSTKDPINLYSNGKFHMTTSKYISRLSRGEYCIPYNNPNYDTVVKVAYYDSSNKTLYITAIYRVVKNTGYYKGTTSYGKVSSTNMDEYPSDGYKDGYWYIRQ